MATRRALSKDGSIHVTDEIYNTRISATGFVLTLIGTVVLLSPPIREGEWLRTAALGIFCFGVLSVFATSMFHHGIDANTSTESFLRLIDYLAIYLQIAGTFTPFCLLVVRGAFGFTCLAVVWFLAFLGMMLKLFNPRLPRWVDMIFYIGMGWLGLFIVYPLYQALPLAALVLLILGGLFFTGGSFIYYFEKPNPRPGRFGFHEIWHLHVLGGSASHFLMMYFYILPVEK